MTVVSETDYSFALCLTHDVDRPFKTPFHGVYYALREQNPRHLTALASQVNPYWQFEDIMELEADLGVRSAFYFLSEPPLWSHSLSELLDPDTIIQTFGRYDLREQPLSTVVERLAEGGWEIGLHGSLHTTTDRERLLVEKARIESVLDGPVTGGRQHYLTLEAPETWRHHRAIGLNYDASLGSRTDCGFQFGYDVRHPFDDEFAVFPLTLMEQHLPDPADGFWDAWAVCESLLETAEDNDAVMTVLWHPRFFSQGDFPGYRRLYRRLVLRATERGAWIGSPGEFYQQFSADPERVSNATGAITER